MNYYDKHKVYLETRSQESLSDNELKLLEMSKLEKYAPVEVWTACGSNQQLAYSTHGAFRYFGKFPPPIATHLIQTYCPNDEVVFDPMCGSGTTGVEATIMEKRCILNDINPLSTLLAKVKTTYIPEDSLRKELENICNSYRPLKPDEYNFEPTYLKNHSHWFLSETSDSLRGIKYLIDTIQNKDVKDFYNVCFSGIIRRVSRATTQQGRLFLDVETAELNALPFFKKRSEAAIAGVVQLPKTNKISIYSYDIREIPPDELTECANLIICHPPYFNSYKYSSINSLELAWLDIDYAHLRKKEVREFFKVGKEENAKHYVTDMVLSLKNLHTNLKDNGYLALMIGDTIMHNNYIDVTNCILQQISNEYDIEKIVLRAPKYTEAAWVASQRRNTSKVGVSLYDFVIIMRKK